MKTPAARRIGLVIFAAALVVRVVWVLLRWRQSGAALEFPDEQLHWDLARNLVTHGEMVSDDGRYVARMPLYPLFLTLFAWIGSAGILAARLAQCAVSAASAWLAHHFADSAMGYRPAIIAGVLVAVDPYAIFFCNLLLTETPFILIGLSLTYFAWQVAARPAGEASATRRQVKARVLGVGLFGTGAVMMRPSALGWVVLLWIVLSLYDAKRGRATRRLGMYVVLFVAAMVPWGLRNYAVAGGFAWLSTNGGVTLYDALGPQADGSSDQRFLRAMPELQRLDEIERDRRLYELALEQVRRDPARVLRLAWVKFKRTWSLTPNVESYRGGATALVSAGYTGVVLLLALASLLRHWFDVRHGGRTLRDRASRVQRRNRSRLLVLLWLPVVYFTLVHCVYIGSVRYRIPLMPLLSLSGAALVASRNPERASGAE